MSSPNLIRIFARAWRFVAFLSALGLVLTVGFSSIQPLMYSSTVRLLITQTNVTGLDPYTAVKSTERIAQNLAEVVYSSSFFNSVVGSGKVDASYFPQDENDKRRLWAETISVSVAPGTGVMTVVAYHPSREQAAELSIRTAQEIASQAPNYFGYSVRAQIIDDPLPSRFFAKPDLTRNGIFGAVAGFLLGTAWVLARIKSV